MNLFRLACHTEEVRLAHLLPSTRNNTWLPVSSESRASSISGAQNRWKWPYSTNRFGYRIGKSEPTGNRCPLPSSESSTSSSLLPAEEPSANRSPNFQATRFNCLVKCVNVRLSCLTVCPAGTVQWFFFKK